MTRIRECRSWLTSRRGRQTARARRLARAATAPLRHGARCVDAGGVTQYARACSTAAGAAPSSATSGAASDGAPAADKFLALRAAPAGWRRPPQPTCRRCVAQPCAVCGYVMIRGPHTTLVASAPVRATDLAAAVTGGAGSVWRCHSCRRRYNRCPAGYARRDRQAGWLARTSKTSICRPSFDSQCPRCRMSPRSSGRRASSTRIHAASGACGMLTLAKGRASARLLAHGPFS